jgi:hypothetical protein
MDPRPNYQNVTIEDVDYTFVSKNDFISSNCIYGYHDPETLKIRYIGKTINGKNRIFDFKRHEFAHVGNWLKSLKYKNLEPKVSILAEFNNSEFVNLYEIMFISELRKRGEDLTNCTLGGDGSGGTKWSIETRQKMKLVNERPDVKARKSAASKISQNRLDVKEKISISTRIALSKQEVKAKMSLSHIGKKHSAKSKAKMSITQKRIKNLSEAKAKMSLIAKVFNARPEVKRVNSLKHRKISDDKANELVEEWKKSRLTESAFYDSHPELNVSKQTLHRYLVKYATIS